MILGVLIDVCDCICVFILFCYVVKCCSMYFELVAWFDSIFLDGCVWLSG